MIAGSKLHSHSLIPSFSFIYLSLDSQDSEGPAWSTGAGHGLLNRLTYCWFWSGPGSSGAAGKQELGSLDAASGSSSDLGLG